MDVRVRCYYAGDRYPILDFRCSAAELITLCLAGQLDLYRSVHVGPQSVIGGY